MCSCMCSLMISLAQLSVSLLLPDLLWLMATDFQTSVSSILVVSNIINHYIIIFTVTASTPELSEEL